MDSFYVKIVPDAPKMTSSQPTVLYAPKADLQQYGVIKLPSAYDLTPNEAVRRAERGLVIVGLPSDNDSSAAASVLYVKNKITTVENKITTVENKITTVENKKLDVITVNEKGEHVKASAYVMDDNGNPSIKPYTRKSDIYTIMCRDNQGNSLVKTPVDPDNEHIVNVEMLKRKIDTIPDASGTTRGMMTIEQFNALSALSDMMSEDKDELINTIRDVLDAFEGAGEDLNVVTSISSLKKSLDTKLPYVNEVSSVYVNNSKGIYDMIPYSSEANGSTIMSRSGNGRANINDPMYDLNIVNLRYMRNHCVLFKEGNAHVYVNTDNGVLGTLPYSSTPMSSSIVTRTVSGTTQVSYPVNSSDAANKQYVDDNTGMKADVIEIEQDSVDATRWYWRLQGYKFYIITAHITLFDDNVYSECDTATWVVSNGLFSDHSGEIVVYHSLPPYTFNVSIDDVQTSHTVRCIIETNVPYNIASIFCTCNGADVKIIVEGVK